LKIVIAVAMFVALVLYSVKVIPTTAYDGVLAFCFFGARTFFVRVFVSVAEGRPAV